MNWSTLTGGSGAGGQPNASGTVSVSSGATLTVDTTATCGALTYVAPASGASGTVTISGKIMISNSPIHESRRKCLSASAGRQTPRFA
ncbi:MAG: hypothetical protein NTW21_01360 [Verrucomicrobia bacterium]|nr:hypothetical protein [Verrucomicrobiota bacterium]